MSRLSRFVPRTGRSSDQFHGQNAGTGPRHHGGLWEAGFAGLLTGLVRVPAAQPTEPSICSSISRLHSTAYSIGSVRVTGSMNPLTTMLIACSSDSPRLIR
jgi:hypothetical protein